MDKKKLQELRDEITETQEIYDMTTDENDKKVIKKGLDMLKKELEEAEKEGSETEPEKKKVQKKITPKKVVKKKEPTVKKKAEKPTGKTKEESKSKETEKSVKISKVTPDDDKKVVRDILEKEHYKVIIKEIGGKKVKISVKHTDKTVAKNKIESAFTTVSKKVNSEEEKKKYADDLKILSELEDIFKKIIEAIFTDFNSHKTEDLKSILAGIKKSVKGKFAEGGVVGKKTYHFKNKVTGSTLDLRFTDDLAATDYLDTLGKNWELLDF